MAARHKGHVTCCPWGRCTQTQTCSPKAMGEGPCGGVARGQLHAGGALPAVSMLAAVPGNGSVPRLPPPPHPQSTVLLARERLGTDPGLSPERLGTHLGLVGPVQATCIHKASRLGAQAAVDGTQEECVCVCLWSRRNNTKPLAASCAVKMCLCWPESSHSAPLDLLPSASAFHSRFTLRAGLVVLDG